MGTGPCAHVQAAAAHALSILAISDAAQPALAAAKALPSLLAALRATSDVTASDAIVSALGNRICNSDSYTVSLQS